MEEVISYFSNLFFNLKDPLSGFKVYKTSILETIILIILVIIS